ncbi:hypothetical protein [Catellatospora sp. NPDC049609]|uniref:hypothetical protein n=1 Tax=Catellatospora sp. NPDC049609 TaxID=3155505 RepID=UPI003428CD19
MDTRRRPEPTTATRRIPAGLLPALLLAATLAGCGTTQPAGGSPPAAPAVPIELDAAALDLVTWSGTFPAGHHLVLRAMAKVTADCMRTHGFTWTPYAAEPPLDGTDEQRTLDLERRRRDGYGLWRTDGDGAQEPPSADPAADEPRYQQALNGDPARTGSLDVPGLGTITYALDGCTARGYATVFGDITTWARVAYLPQGINRTAARTAAAHPRHGEALAAWSRCMAGHGHRYATPDDIRVALGTAYRQSGGRAEDRREAEVALAVQDARCDQQVRLTATELELRREAVRALAVDQRAEIARLSAGFTAAVARARSLLAA